MKRFYQQAAAAPAGEGWELQLDGKPMKSPARQALVVPTRAAAEALAEEWNSQAEQIDRSALRLTGYAALAVDGDLSNLRAELAGYGETDLLFYREDAEARLQDAQRREWDPWVRQAEERLGTRYRLTEGIMPVEQPEGNAALHAGWLEGLDRFTLALLAGVVKPSTSLLLGLAFLEGKLAGREMLRLAQLEEDFNQQRWGVDDEAAARRDELEREFAAAERWRDALNQHG